MKKYKAVPHGFHKVTASFEGYDQENQSIFSFDFTYRSTYDETAIRSVVEDVFHRFGCEVTGLDFYSVDYSSYPEYANKNVSQCGVDFSWYGDDYNDSGIVSALEEEMMSLGYEVIGSNFETSFYGLE